MSKVRTPKTLAAATALLARYSDIAAKVASAEADRQSAVAATNAAVDAVIEPMVGELADIRTALEPWWSEAKADLTQGKRKSIELGGCTIGCKASRDTLTFTGGDDVAGLAALQGARWAKPYVRVTYAIDRTATLKAIDGKHKDQLLELGFSKKPGEDQFFVTRVDSADAKVSARL